MTLSRAGLVDDDGQHVHFVCWQGAEVNDCRLPPWQREVAVNAQVSLDLRDAICESFLDVMDKHLRPWQDAVKRNTLGVEVSFYFQLYVSSELESQGVLEISILVVHGDKRRPHLRTKVRQMLGPKQGF